MQPRERLIVALDDPDTVDDVYDKLVGTVSFFKIGHTLLVAGGIAGVPIMKSMGQRVFLDMKLLDIGTTVREAVKQASILGIDFLTIHGQDAETLRAAAAGRSGNLKLLAVTTMTSTDNAELTMQRAQMAIAEGMDGVICPGGAAQYIRAIAPPGFQIVCPGIRLAGTTDDHRAASTPLQAIVRGADYIVVGRPITQADDPKAAAETFIAEIAKAALFY